MLYGLCLPSLLCGLAVSVTDVRFRRVPRRWIVAAVVVQLFVFAAAACVLAAGTPWDARLWIALTSTLSPLAYGVFAAALQCGLALIRPGSLGFGDVTTAGMVGIAVGAFGLTAFLTWWVVMGVFGLLLLAVWPVVSRQWPTRADYRSDSATALMSKVPFVPVIVLSGLVAVLW